MIKKSIKTSRKGEKIYEDLIEMYGREIRLLMPRRKAAKNIIAEVELDIARRRKLITRCRRILKLSREARNNG
jgi:PHP family Zn ribbon phosphoesterase